MISEVILSPESFMAYVTGIWSLISVSPFMDQKVVRLSESSLTVLADELLLWSGGAPSSRQLSLEIVRGQTHGTQCIVRGNERVRVTRY